MKKSLVAFYAMLLTMVAGVPIAYAGCMDDAGDAFAAFFSGGVSYAVCQTIETVKSMIRVIETIVGSMERMTRDTINTAQRLVNDTANSIAGNTRNAMNQLNGMVNEARRLAAAPPPSAPSLKTKIGAPTSPAVSALKQTGTQAQAAQLRAVAPVPKANPAELQAALRQGADTLGRIHSTLQSQAVNHILSATELAKNQAVRHLNAARRIAETSVMAPLRQLEEMMNNLLRNPERIFDPTSLVNESIERLTRAMTQVVEQMHREITHEALATIQGIDQHIRRVTGDTASAQRIHQAMVKAHRTRTQQALNELRAALGSAPGGGSSTRTAAMVHLSPGMRTLLAMPNIQQLRQNSLQQAQRPYLQHVNTLKLHGAKLQNLRTAKLPAGAEQRAKAELDRLLKGKSPAEAEQIKRNLKNQLQAKYRNNPKVLANLNRNFDSRFAAHLRANPRLLRAVPTGRTGLLLPAVQK